jgi:hypothetical protein
MFKKLYRSMTPRVIRIGDSEAREKLKSRHGLVMMPGLGRIEWLQIVSPEIYGDIYNPSELVAAPGYQTEIWDDGALFMRVYDDPNEWDSEDNISQANFIPGFLAGVAKIRDSEKEKETLRDLEKLWSRAEKTAEKAYEALNADPNNVPKEDVKKVEPEKPAEVVEEAPAPAALDDADASKRAVIYNRLKAEYKVDENNIVKCGTEADGRCTLFKVKAEKKPPFYTSYQDSERKVFILSVLEDLSRFLAFNGCSVKQEHCEHIKELVGKYYRPDYVLLNSLEDLPDTVIRDRRMPEIRKQFKPAAVENVNGNQVLTFWFYKPEFQGLETLTLTQFEEWPMQLDAKVQCSDMENEPEVVEPPKPAEPPKVEAPKAEPPKAEIPKAEPPKPEVPKAEPPKPAVPKPEPRSAKTDLVKADEASDVEESSSGGKVVVIIIVLLIIAYVACAYFLGENPGSAFDWTFFQHM